MKSKYTHGFEATREQEFRRMVDESVEVLSGEVFVVGRIVFESRVCQYRHLLLIFCSQTYNIINEIRLPKFLEQLLHILGR